MWCKILGIRITCARLDFIFKVTLISVNKLQISFAADVKTGKNFCEILSASRDVFLDFRATAFLTDDLRAFLLTLFLQIFETYCFTNVTN